MKVALVTTTINVPHVLRLYRSAGPDVRFFVAGDLKTPSKDVAAFCLDIGNVCFLDYADQKCQPYECSELIGFHTIGRRNIATLEALKWGADILVFVDDDNIPTDAGYFRHYETHLGLYEWNGLLASPEQDWFDVGKLYDPPASHRGFPHQINAPARFSFASKAKIGAHAGLVIGDPDISAITRIARHPTVHRFSETLRSGVAVNPRYTRTVWNTQNSAVIRELAPAMLLCPQFKRYDDIIASLVCQRIMAETGHHVLFGPPVVWQERNVHDLARDLTDEAWGQAHLLDVVHELFSSPILPDRIPGMVSEIYERLDEWMPGVSDLAEAWLSDCERAMAEPVTA